MSLLDFTMRKVGKASLQNTMPAFSIILMSTLLPLINAEFLIDSVQPRTSMLASSDKQD